MSLNQISPGEDLQIDDRYDAYEVYINYWDRRSSGTSQVHKSAIKHFEDFLNKNNYKIGDVGRDEANQLFDYLKELSIFEDTASEYVSHIGKMFNYLQSIGALEWNPIFVEYHNSVFEGHETIKIPIPIRDLREGVSNIKYPTNYAQIFTALKTGKRLGELINTDLRDINLDHKISKYMPDPRSEIADKNDTIFINSSITAGDVYNGEKRNNSNKRKKDTVIPIDRELKRVLVWYISSLPPSPSPAKPLFRNFGISGGTGTVGVRRSSGNTGDHFREIGIKNGWRNEDTNRVEGFTPHWCRHWFTTQLRNRISSDEISTEQESQSVERYIKGLRGDKGDDVIDLYTHDWDDKPWLRSAYINNIPKLLI